MVLNMVSSPQGKGEARDNSDLQGEAKHAPSAPEGPASPHTPPINPLSITWMFPMSGSKQGFNHLENPNEEQEQITRFLHVTRQEGQIPSSHVSSTHFIKTMRD